MCEILAVAFPGPEPWARVRPWALALERMGVAGFGWGVAWVEDGAVRGYRDPGRLHDDRTGDARLGAIRSHRYLVHLRRPSQLTTVSLADSQPFVAEDGSVAFAHTGRFEEAERLRPRFAGQLAGRADSEVGFRLFEALMTRGDAPADAVAATHRQLGGAANLGVLTSRGELLLYAGNPGNQVWQFRLEDAAVASTALHSADQALVSLCLPSARDAAPVAGGVATIAAPDPVQPVRPRR